MDWLVLPTIAAAEARGEALSAAAGDPRPASRTERLSPVPIEHPTNGEGALAIGVTAWSWVADAQIEVRSLLTDAERAALYDRAEMDAAGWFPASPPTPPGE